MEKKTLKAIEALDLVYYYGDDFVDRVHSYYTVAMLCLCSTFLFAKQYAGEPIRCWLPAQFKNAWKEYAEHYCFVENTYYVPLEEPLPPDQERREQLELSYYQWVPVVLLIQAVVFHIPHIVWRFLNINSEIDVSALVRMAFDANTNDSQDGLAYEISVLAEHIERACVVSSRIRRTASKRRKIFNVVIQYLGVKLLYIFNVIGQMAIIKPFLGTSYTLWGSDIMTDILHDKQWPITGHFPRVTMCDLEVRALGNVHRWSIQCVLMANMFSEKIYMFIWWWFSVICFVTVINFGWWALFSLTAARRLQYLSSYLPVDTADSGVKQRNVVLFEQKLGSDGVFALRLIANNVGDIFTSRLVLALWNDFQKDGFAKPFSS